MKYVSNKIKKVILLLLIAFYSIQLYSQNYILSGIIADAGTGENLISANIYESITLQGAISNSYGFYSLKLPEGKVTVIFSYIGYQTQEIELDLINNVTLNVELVPSLEIEEVIITDKGPQKTVRTTQMSMVELPILKAKQMPVLLGEVDVIKSLQLMPGVQGGTEGSSGMYVRGGGPDQNLILLDGVPVYNVTHLFGFFSVFNADAIKTVSLTKGGFPARYGGRLSSVLDIRMKDGNMKEFHGEGSIGLISSKLTLEGPIKKDKSSFIISGRRTYIDILSYPFQLIANKNLDYDGKFFVGYYFYDFNSKFNYKFNNKNRIYLSAYMGRDKFFVKDKYSSGSEGFSSYYSYDDKGGMKWGNITLALRWNHIFYNNLFSNATLTFSDYTFKTFFESYNEQWQNGENYIDDYSYLYYSRIRDFGVKYDFDYLLNENQYLKFGINNTLYIFSPGVSVFNDDGNNNTQALDTSFGNTNIPSNEFYLYVEDEISIGQKLKMNVGFHYSNFYVANTLYHSYEPRLSFRYLITNSISFKASYAGMTQYLNLLSNSTIGLPTDLWVPSTDQIKPQQAWQAGTGIAIGIKDNYEITLEGFYKSMNNLLEYSEGASFFDLNEEWESLVTQGKGESYGVELFAQKTKGKLSGWVGYTLSWSNRQFDEISFGKTFPFKYDRRHDVSVVATYKFSGRFDMGATWVYGTGNTFTLADEKYISIEWVEQEFLNEGIYNSWWAETLNSTEYFETRNSYRMLNYHRLDIGINMHKNKKWGIRTWSIGVYNIYARQNPFMIYPREEYNPSTNSYETVLKQISILTYIPYIRYSFSF